VPDAQSLCAAPSDERQARAFVAQEVGGTLLAASGGQLPPDAVEAGAAIEIVRPASTHRERMSIAVQRLGVRVMAAQ
jgi:hypothetical protein